LGFILSKHWPLRHAQPEPEANVDRPPPLRRALCSKCREQHVFRVEQSTVRAQE
jgi:hypothetical protein